MKRKQGISLIVLVITIIVMIILASSVVITLSNTGIINKASEATDATNLQQVQQLATLTWADGYMDALRGNQLKDYVLDQMKDYTDDFDIDVTDQGVEVNKKGEGTIEPIDYYTYDYDSTTMTAALKGVQEKYAVTGYYNYRTDKYPYTTAIKDDAGNTVTEVAIPSKVVNPADGKEYTVTSIKAGVFSATTYGSPNPVIDDQSQFTKIILPDTLTNIEDGAFALCVGIEEIAIPEGVTTIGYGTFEVCKSLKKIMLPKTLTYVELWAFGYVDTLKDVYYAGTELEWASVTVDTMGNTSFTSATMHYNHVAK